MTQSDGSDGAAPGPSRWLLAMLDPRRRLDYLWLALLGGLPSLVAWQIGAARGFEHAGERWLGYWDKPNLWPQVVLLPLLLLLFRLFFARFAGVAGVTPGSRLPALVLLQPPGPRRELAYRELRASLASPRLARMVLGLVAVLMVLDLWGVVRVYATDRLTDGAERDWALMYLTGAVGKGENLVLLAAAYLVQLALFLVRFVGIFVIAAHGLFFLRHVWQRRRAAADPSRAWIHVDLDDTERCLGLRPASAAFDLPVILVVLGGLGILVSRFANVMDADGLHWPDLLQWPPRVLEYVGFSDVGQWILGAGWLLAVMAISLPALVRLLPLFGPKGPELTATEFLREFLADDRGAPDAAAPAARVDALAARFARQAYWPAGDNRARALFFFAGLVLATVLLPVRAGEPSVLLGILATYALVAWFLQRAVFAALRLPLAFVDSRLVDARAPIVETGGAAPPAPAAEAPIDLRVFVSYRRADSRGFARLVHGSLVRALAPGRLFIDVEDLRDGEDYVVALERAVGGADVALVVIGPEWATIAGPDGLPRLQQEDDLVRREVELALERVPHVVPVLVGGAELPAPESLPPMLRPLLRRQARILADTHWDYDIERLVEALRGIAARSPAREDVEARSGP